MFRKIVVVLMGAVWAAFAYLLWPEGIADRGVGGLTIADLLKLGSIGSVAVGIVLTIWSWRS